jgi:hypothetical protein
LDVVDRLDRGDLVLVVGTADRPGERFASALPLEDLFVMVMRHGLPASPVKLPPAKFAALAHLEISSSSEDTSFIDSWPGE